MFSKVGDALLWGKVFTKPIVIIMDSSLTFDDHFKKIVKSLLENSQVFHECLISFHKTETRSYFEDVLNLN